MTSTRTAPARSLGVLGIVLVLVGAAMIFLSFAVLDWYPGSTDPSAVAHVGFAELGGVSTGDRVPALSSEYFAWLAGVFLLLMIAIGSAANLPTRASGLLRVLGALIGIGGVVATYYALDGLSRLNEGDYPLHKASAGIWLTLAGYVVAGVGAAIGPIRAR